MMTRVIGASRLMMEEGINGLATSLHSCLHLDDSFLTLIEGRCPKQQKCNGDWPDLKNLTPRMFKANEDEHLNKTIFTFEHLKGIKIKQTKDWNLEMMIDGCLIASNLPLSIGPVQSPPLEKFPMGRGRGKACVACVRLLLFAGYFMRKILELSAPEEKSTPR
uniref:Uncharacterized protein LOC111124235 n=1 Tax=Crassostrea virginica TaxID=6565 RepID=A0A8B8D553_CRAVI|nr:uncharacterized protein LOC111124235 [Crassostrea virginica]